jgi:hypothetical protein
MLLQQVVVFENVRSHFLHAICMLRRSYSVIYNVWVLMSCLLQFCAILSYVYLYVCYYVLTCSLRVVFLGEACVPFIDLVKVKVKCTLLLAVYRQSVRVGARPLETHDQRFFFQLNSCGNSPYVTSYLTRRWGCLSRMCLAFRQVYISHMWYITEFFILHYTPVLCQYWLYRANHAYLTYIMLQRQLVDVFNLAFISF